MALAHFRMLINELLKPDPYIVPEGSHLVVLYSKSTMCIDNNGRDTKHTRHIPNRIQLLSNGEEYKMHRID